MIISEIFSNRHVTSLRLPLQQCPGFDFYLAWFKNFSPSCWVTHSVEDSLASTAAQQNQDRQLGHGVNGWLSPRAMHTCWFTNTTHHFSISHPIWNSLFIYSLLPFSTSSFAGKHILEASVEREANNFLRLMSEEYGFKWKGRDGRWTVTHLLTGKWWEHCL